MTKACAEAMNVELPDRDDPVAMMFVRGKVRTAEGWTKYDPLHDDAQAMALVKRFNMGIGQDSEGRWSAVMQKPTYCQSFHHATLNAAIVHCVAALQRERGK